MFAEEVLRCEGPDVQVCTGAWSKRCNVSLKSRHRVDVFLFETRLGDDGRYICQTLPADPSDLDNCTLTVRKSKRDRERERERERGGGGGADRQSETETERSQRERERERESQLVWLCQTDTLLSKNSPCGIKGRH